MSLVITGSNLVITFFMLIALNGFFCFKKIPILAFPIAIISILFLIGFNIDYSGFIVILTLVLIATVICSGYLNYEEFNR
jgi:hypothetical protein